MSSRKRSRKFPKALPKVLFWVHPWESAPIEKEDYTGTYERLHFKSLDLWKRSELSSHRLEKAQIIHIHFLVEMKFPVSKELLVGQYTVDYCQFLVSE